LKREADTPLHRLCRWQSGETPGPWTITLIPTNRCNLHCLMCWQRQIDADCAAEVSSLIGDTEACDALRPPPDRQEELAIYVHRAVRRAESLGMEQNLITLLPNGARNGLTCPSGAVTGCRSDTDLSFAVCFEPWLSMTIFPDGRAGPCCVFWDCEADSVQHRSLRDVWLGPFLQRVRRDLRDGVAWRQCAQCLSIMQVRNESFRERLRLQQMNLPRRAAVRAREWTRLGKKW